MMFRRKFLVVLALATTATLITGCGATDDPPPAAAALLRIAAVEDPGSLDPVAAIGPQTYYYYQAVYDSLLRVKPDGTIVPMLAEEWEYNDDLTDLTLKLRTDVTFADGTVFDAEVAKANLLRYRDSSASDAATLSGITEIDVVDDATVQLHLAQPDPALLITLTTPAGYQVNPASFDDPDLQTQPAGTGPYLLDESTVVGSSYVYTRNPDYWDPDLMPYDEIVVTVLADETARVNAIQTGQVDFTPITNPASVPTLEAAGLELTRTQVNWFGLNFFDRNGVMAPPLADVKVRQAISHAIDAEAMLETLAGGNGYLTGQIFPPTSEAYDPALDDRYDYDPEEARTLLAEAGYPDGFELSMASQAGYIDPAYFVNLQQFLADVGITLTFTELPTQDYSGAMLQAQFPMGILPFAQLNDWAVINQQITPNGRWNVFHVEDPKALDLVRTIQFEDGEARTEALRELNQYVVEQAWFDPWFLPDLLYFTSSGTVVEPQAGRVLPYLYNFTPAG